MRISTSWLRRFFAQELPADAQIVSDLCATGTEAVLILSGNDSWCANVVVAEITATTQHPNADRLRLCEVRTPDKEYSIVCGAANARPGIKVALAPMGTELPGNFVIKKSKIRGIESYGMLCSATELGLGEESDGILELDSHAIVGQLVASHLGIAKSIIECELTANRGDCLSALGMARELAAIYDKSIIMPSILAPVVTDDAIIDVKVSAQEGCPLYTATVIEGVDANLPTPKWIVDELEASNIAQHNIIVDITNYVMLELGQPLHAFDAERLDGALEVRLAQADEKAVLLNGKEYLLAEDSLVIADSKKVLALAGIMGSLDSGCDKETKSVVLEGAFFAPHAVSGRARFYGLHTDASHRFERGVDISGVLRAVERATNLLLDYAGGSAGKRVEVKAENPVLENPKILVDLLYLNSVLGVDLDQESVGLMLKRIACEFSTDAGVFTISPPSYRWDISQDVDIVEEVGRLHGFNNIAIQHIAPPIRLSYDKSAPRLLNQLTDFLAGSFYETINYSFIEGELTAHFVAQEPLVLQNPIVETQAAMRTHILPSLLKNIHHNRINNNKGELRFFEAAQVYCGSLEDLNQSTMIAGVIAAGKIVDWRKTSRCDFYWLKQFISELLALVPIVKYKWQKTSRKYYHPGKSVAIEANKCNIGHIGFIHPNILNDFGIKEQVLAFELDYDLLHEFCITKTRPIAYTQVAKTPIAQRDFSFIVRREIDFTRLQSYIRKHAGSCLRSLTLFDLHKGKPLADDEIGMAVHLEWQHQTKTLTDDEVSVWAQQIVNALAEQNIRLRDETH